jgi:hypothetical protein
MRYSQLFLALVLVGSLAYACGFTEYFKNPDNQGVLLDAGISCFLTPETDVKIGAVYVFRRNIDNSITATQSGEFIVGCHDKLFTVECDLTKKPEDKPCSNVRAYMLKNESAGLPVAWVQ